MHINSFRGKRMKKIRTRIIRISICVCKGFLNIIYYFMKICPTKNKIVMLSRQTNKPSIDFELIQKEILQRTKNIEVTILCRTLKKDIRERINYCFYILKCMYHIVTAKVCILDSYSIPISILKHKKGLKIIQIWHASGAIKKFGYQSLNKKEGRGTEIARIMNMHKNYSHVMAPSEITAKFYEEAFGINKDKLFINGLPRIDYLLDKKLGKDKIHEFYKEYPKFRNKKTILYVPTFRKDKDCTDIVKGLINTVNLEKYNLIIQLHPLDKSADKSKYTVNKKYNTFDLLKISDYIITDYSAVAFETSILNKPLYFYLYDLNNYKKTRGLNVNLLKEMNHCASANIKEIIKAIEEDEYDYEQLEKFRSKYMINDYNNTKRLVDFIFKYLDKDAGNGESKNSIDEYGKKELNV